MNKVKRDGKVGIATFATEFVSNDKQMAKELLHAQKSLVSVPSTEYLRLADLLLLDDDSYEVSARIDCYFL